MKTGTVPRKEAAHGGVRAERAQQLDVVLAHAQQDRLDALRLDRLAVLQLEAEPIAVEHYRLVEVLHRHSDVVYPPEHGR